MKPVSDQIEIGLAGLLDIAFLWPMICNQPYFHALHVAEGEIKQSSYGLKCSALFTRSSTPLISPVQYPPRAPGPNAATNVVAGPEVCGWGNRWGVDEDEGREGLKEVEALEEGRSSEEEEKEDSKQNVRAMEKEETLEESGSRGREVCGDRDKTKDDLHISSLTISECMCC